jgi:HSP20 family molecular chaperone IbpA
VAAELPAAARENIDVQIADRALIAKAEVTQREREGAVRRSIRCAALSDRVPDGRTGRSSAPLRV